MQRIERVCKQCGSEFSLRPYEVRIPTRGLFCSRACRTQHTKEKAVPEMTQTYLRSIMEYDPDTGLFTWIAPRPKATVGKTIGTLTPLGYITIGIDGCRYMAHRLAWFYVHGVWPPEQLDHKNRRRDDNRLDNLRLANNSQNSANKLPVSKFGKGVKFHPKAKIKPWSAYIQKDLKQWYIGSFASAEEARAAYNAEAQKVFGEYARINDAGPVASTSF